MRLPRTRRAQQSGATLVELLVATVIMGFALAIVVGTFSTGLLDSAIAKRNTAAVAVTQYELDLISGSAFNPGAQSYSDCFATENPTSPLTTLPSLACPSGPYTLRADVSMSLLGANSQQWTITVLQLPGGNQVGSPVSLIKVNR